MIRMLRKKSRVGVLLFLLLLVLVTGCRKNVPTLTVFNWGDYMDESIIEEFEKEFNVRVIYDTFSTNEDMYVRLRSGATDYDVLIPSEYMISRLIQEDLLLPLNFSKLPNYRYIVQDFRDLDFDPDNAFSVPYTWGTIGILYNKTLVDTLVDSWDILWDERYSKQILMLDSQRDSIGVALLRLGYSLNTLSLAELEEAGRSLREQKPLVLAYVLDEGKDKMMANEAALAVVWSGDAITSIRQNPDLDYAIPKEGTNLWFDSMVVPKSSKNQDLAHTFINFLLRPEIAHRNIEYIGYSTPHGKARELLSPEDRFDPRAYPDLHTIKTEVYHRLGSMLREYDRVWTEVKAF